MAAPVVQPSKSAKKKGHKVIERTESPAPSITSNADKTGDDNESPYIKELQKNIRNVNKKITNASKTDSLLSQHSGKSLDELVASKIINTDQKAQILKKPALQAQLAQYEEQLVQYQKVDEQYRTRATADKAEFEKTLEKAKVDAANEAKQAGEEALKKNLLVLSQFLRLAAYRREEAKDPESDESQAIEGVLLAIYSGDENAVQSMLKLVNGTEDQIVSVPGEQLQTTYSTVRTLAEEYKTPYDGQPADTEAVSDPTIANAAATEIEAGDSALSNAPAPEPTSNGINNASVADDAANAVAENSWDNSANNELSASQEWVDVKAETEAAAPAVAPAAAPAPTPATATASQSWADDHPEHPAETPTAPADPNEGFHQVQRNKSRNEGNHRGRGRGRGGFRGDGRGRGRGNRGAGGPPRGRRNEES